MYIAGFGHYHPDRIVDNRELSATVDTNEAWIDARTGISERRVADESTTVSHMGADALTSALDAADWDPSSIDVLICSTCSADHILAAVASQIGGRVGTDAIAFDIGAACSGFIFGLQVAEGLFATGRYRRIALVAAEKMTAVVRPNSRESVYFGDAAGAVLLTQERPRWGAEIVDSDLRSHNAYFDKVIAERAGYFYQDAAFVYDFALKNLVETGRDLLSRNELEVQDLRAVIGHQANLRLLEHVMSELGVDELQHWHNVELCGNQASAGVATVLSSHVQEHRDTLVDGDLIALQTVGAGFSLGAALLRWVVAE